MKNYKEQSSNGVSPDPKDNQTESFIDETSSNQYSASPNKLSEKDVSPTLENRPTQKKDPSIPQLFPKNSNNNDIWHSLENSSMIMTKDGGQTSTNGDELPEPSFIGLPIPHS